jgi:hypothetical protein
MAHKQTAINTEAMKQRVRTHQPVQDVFKAILAVDIDGLKSPYSATRGAGSKVS